MPVSEWPTLAAEPLNAGYAYWLARLDYDSGRYAAAIDRLLRALDLGDQQRLRPRPIAGGDRLVDLGTAPGRE